MSNWKRFLVGFDIHGNEQDVEVNKAFFKFQKMWKPDLTICGGDLWNFAALRKKASEEEKRESLLDDYEAGNRWLETVQPDVFLRGNHCERLWKLTAANRGPMSDLANKCIGEIEAKLKKIGCNTMLPYNKIQGVYRIGSLKVIHGYACGVNAARKQAQVYGSVLCGHGHAIQHVAVESIENRVGRMCGCLCKLDMEYVEATLGSLLWRHGWAYGVYNELTGTYHVWQAEQIDGVWVLPTNVKEL